jgi:hypothetical protein
MKTKPSNKPDRARMTCQTTTAPSPPPHTSPPVLRTDQLKEQVDEVFARHPQIDLYIRGSKGSGPLSAESVVACYFLETVSHTSWSAPLRSTEQSLRECERRVRKRLLASSQETSSSGGWNANNLSLHLDLFSSVGAGAPPADKQPAIVRLLTIQELLRAQDRSHEMFTAEGRFKMPTDSDFTLAVKSRPDLTQLKKHLLKRGGKSFQRNDYLALQIDPVAAAMLIADGTFRAGTNLIYQEMEPSACHQNALIAACCEGVELWRGFGLSEDLWAFHSWCVFNGRIIETTREREIYFGVHVPVPFHKLLVAATIHNMVAEHSHTSSR